MQFCILIGLDINLQVHFEPIQLKTPLEDWIAHICCNHLFGSLKLYSFSQRRLKNTYLRLFKLQLFRHKRKKLNLITQVMQFCILIGLDINLYVHFEPIQLKTPLEHWIADICCNHLFGKPLLVQLYFTKKAQK